MLPLREIGILDLAYLSKHAVVEDHAVQTAEGLESQVHGLLTEGEIGQVSIEHFDLLAVLLLELLERFATTSDHDNIVGLGCGEEIFRDGEADSWMCECGQ